jgi:hypothetical protein
MPHTIHLAALKLLEGIGAVAKPKPDRSKSTFLNYQDDVVRPLDRKFDIEAAPDLEDEEHDSTVDGILPAVSKVRFFCLYTLILI